MDQIASLAAEQPTRSAGLARLEAFRPNMGSRYAKGRNYDNGPGRHTAVSTLSPYIRRRLVTEEEAVRMALSEFPLSACEKFVQEVFWRTYFKGWLEGRPSVWMAYRAGLARDLDAIAGDRALAKRIAQAEEGRTGLDCFDAWAEELVETGYLHNHARMWFASLWIFTLELPWRVGADFFLRHLLDGDPASNTLGWRWVAGLHTKGKNYSAQAWNIAKFTRNRFQPEPREINEAAVPLEEHGETPPHAPPRLPEPFEPTRPTVLLITEEDCRPEELIATDGLLGVAALEAPALRSPRDVADHVGAFDHGALMDAADRLERAPHWLAAGDPASLADWARAQGAEQVVTPFVPVGPVRDWLDEAERPLGDAGIRLAEVRRDWDTLTWPSATAGFFKVKSKIPKVLGQIGIG
ncbi:MAG: FAD-binding domain-containing protein [Paracoccaceae bacterium]